MNNNWDSCKNVLCIRPDNMGDLLMSSPAFAAIKHSFGCKITLLTSSMAAPISQFIPEIDDTIVFDLPWVKKTAQKTEDGFLQVIDDIKSRRFDAAIIFTVYSQNPLPSVMIAYLAGIPLRLSYCRENPYELLTHWIPDKEPFTFIQHQVKRDLALANFVGAYSQNDELRILLPEQEWDNTKNKLAKYGVDTAKSLVVLHPGVSEAKREYPIENWVATAKEIVKNIDCEIIFTGGVGECELTSYLAAEVGKNSFSLGGVLSLSEFMLLLRNASLIISVNTVTVHVAAATGTPVIVLYGFTNPQHFPWKAKGKVFPYQVASKLRSKNEIIKYVADNLHPDLPYTVQPSDIAAAAYDILINKKIVAIPLMPAMKGIQPLQYTAS